MILTALIVGISLALFVLWFRSAVTLMLRTGVTVENDGKAVGAQPVGFLEAGQRLYAASPPDQLPLLFEHLKRDYRILTQLIRMVGAGAPGHTAEQRLLMINFRLLTLWFTTSASSH